MHTFATKQGQPPEGPFSLVFLYPNCTQACFPRWQIGREFLRKRRHGCFKRSPESVSLRIGTFGPAFGISPCRHAFFLHFPLKPAVRLDQSLEATPVRPLRRAKLHRKKGLHSSRTEACFVRFPCMFAPLRRFSGPSAALPGLPTLRLLPGLYCGLSRRRHAPGGRPIQGLLDKGCARKFVGGSRRGLRSHRVFPYAPLDHFHSRLNYSKDQSILRNLQYGGPRYFWLAEGPF